MFGGPGHNIVLSNHCNIAPRGEIVIKFLYLKMGCHSSRDAGISLPRLSVSIDEGNTHLWLPCSQRRAFTQYISSLVTGTASFVSVVVTTAVAHGVSWRYLNSACVRYV